jgi:hypothetical protein
MRHSTNKSDAIGYAATLNDVHYSTLRSTITDE